MVKRRRGLASMPVRVERERKAWDRFDELTRPGARLRAAALAPAATYGYFMGLPSVVEDPSDGSTDQTIRPTRLETEIRLGVQETNKRSAFMQLEDELKPAL